MSKANYTLSSKVGPDGRSQVLVRFVASKNEIYRGKTGIWIRPENWDARNGVPRPSRRDQDDMSECRHARARLDALSNYIAERHAEDAEHGAGWLAGLLPEVRWDGDAVADADYGSIASMDMADSCVHMAEADLAGRVFSEATARGYKDLAEKMRRFEERHGRLTVGDFGPSELEAFLSHCRAEYRLSDNTLYDVRARMMRWHRWCADRDTSIRRMPAAAGRVRSRAFGTPYYLTKEQRDALYAAPMPDSDVEAVRDAFVLQCLIGCRVSDLLSLTTDNVKGDRIEYIARKTIHSNPQTISVPLHRTAVEIIAKYAGSGRLVGISDNTWVYRQRLRKAVKASGIDCLVTVRDCHTGQPRQRMLSEVASSHMARRTFIGCLYELGFRESDICSMSGHQEGSLSVQRYRRVSDERKRMMIDSI